MLLYSKTLLGQWIKNVYPIKKILISGISDEKIKEITSVLPVKKEQSLFSINSKLLKKRILESFQDIRVLKISKKYPGTLRISLAQIKEDIIIKINDKAYFGFLLKEEKIIHHNLATIVAKDVPYVSVRITNDEQSQSLTNSRNIEQYVYEHNTLRSVILSLKKLHLTERDFFNCISLIDVDKKVIYSRNHPTTIYMKDFSLSSFSKAKYAYLYGENLYYQKKNKKNQELIDQHVNIDLRLNNLVKYAFQ